MESATFIATVQALYTDFKYLDDTTKLIAIRDSAIGVSITGLMSNPIFAKKEGIQIMTEGAKHVLNVNEYWAKKFGIAPCKRCTTVKPAGNASSILEGVGPGVHPAHDSVYIRRVEITDISPEYKALKGTPMVTEAHGRIMLNFPIDLRDKDIPVFKDSLGALEHIKFIGRVKHFWVNKGVREIDGKKIPNNVSATVQVLPEEKEALKGALFTNSHILTGITFLEKYTEFYRYLPYSSLTTDEVKEDYKAIVEYLENNEVDFSKILSEKEDVDIDTMAAIACAGGACEIP